MSYKTITKESYQSTAAAFAGKVADLAPMKSIERFIELLPSKAKIIDIGSGSGRDAKIFTEHGVSVTGIDFSQNLINIAKVNAPLAEFQLMDIEAMTFPASSFDGAWAAASLLHISKRNFPSVLQNIHSLLKTNGFFYLSLKEGSGEILEKDSRYGDVEKFWSFFEEKELRNMLQSAKFKILDFGRVERNHSYQTHSFFRLFCQKE